MRYTAGEGPSKISKEYNYGFNVTTAHLSPEEGGKTTNSDLAFYQFANTNFLPNTVKSEKQIAFRY